MKLALRADIIDHLRGEINRTEGIEEFVDPASFQRVQISDAEADSILERIREIVKEDIDLAKLVDVMLDTEVTKPRELALLMDQERSRFARRSVRLLTRAAQIFSHVHGKLDAFLPRCAPQLRPVETKKRPQSWGPVFVQSP